VNKTFLLTMIPAVLLMSACGQVATPADTPVITGTSVKGQSATLAATALPVPSKTPREPRNEPTSTIVPPTPLPTIPTFTPTFDVSTIVTVTPAPKAACPAENPSAVAKFATPSSDGSYESFGAPDVLAYLNAGGTVDRLQNSGLEKIADLTGDGLQEVMFKGYEYSFFGCQDGDYQDLFDFAGDFGVGLGGILDLNKNGIPELILYDFVHYGFADIYVFEWNGSDFVSLINVRSDIYPDDINDWLDATDYPQWVDINRDGLKEIVTVFDINQLCGGFGSFCDGTPAREETTILGWNGQNYVVKQRYYAPAQYRFQAVQDGDLATTQKDYSKALTLYQDAIFSDQLAGYSPEIGQNLREVFGARMENLPEPTPYPIDQTVYPKLAAYAYFRIILLHIVQGHESDAGTVYNTLQQKFGNDAHGKPYVEMANAFWNSYHSSQKLYDGCAAAIQYAAEHPGILIPLGSDYHGSQSHAYIPADVCPFR
jgi:hypothetical protein